MRLLAFQSLYGDSELSLNDFSALDAVGADAQPFCAALDLCLYRTKIDAPAPARDIMRVRNIVSELRTPPADLTHLSHDQTPKLNCSRGPSPSNSLGWS
jgi:hypothetical protein